jgi:hypothetical protein
MIPKSGNRFSDKIMLKQKCAAAAAQTVSRVFGILARLCNRRRGAAARPSAPG